jgi:hypothetical protein
MPIPFLSEIERLITEHGSAAVLRERLALANDRFVNLERQVSELEQENAGLRERCDELERQRASEAATKQFEEGRGGALFKRKPGGGYVLAVYCPTCNRATAPWPPDSGQFVCEPCAWFSTFTNHELAAVLAELL